MQDAFTYIPSIDFSFLGSATYYLFITGVWFSIATYGYSQYCLWWTMEIIRYGLSEELKHNFYNFNGLKVYIQKRAGSEGIFVAVTPQTDILKMILQNPAYLSRFRGIQITHLIALNRAQDSLISKAKSDDTGAITYLYLESLISVIEKITECANVGLTTLSNNANKNYVGLHKSFDKINAIASKRRK